MCISVAMSGVQRRLGSSFPGTDLVVSQDGREKLRLSVSDTPVA